MTRRGAAALALALLVPGGAGAQDTAPRGLPGDIALGPRLLEYPIECLDPRGCRIECFQNGTKIATRPTIGVQDEVKLVAAAKADAEVIPRWIEIRPFSGTDVQTLLLSPDTVCDLKSLVISPKPRP